MTDDTSPDDTLDTGTAAAAVGALMPQLEDELTQLVAIPSVSASDYPEETRPALQEAHDAVVQLFRDAGVEHLGSLQLPNTAPIITGEIPAPPGAPTVLLYSHYDVVGAGDESKWESPPWEATVRDGAIFGRGTADTKSNILTHVGALRAWDGKPPVGIKLVIEGQEEVGSVLIDYPATNPDPFVADAMLIADMGSIRPGVPTLTIGLRGMAQIELEVETLAGPKHSGQFGGAAPDALIALLHALASLHDAHGDVTVAGLRREPWSGAGPGEDEFRQLAEVLDDLPLIGSGDLGSRVWSGPAITVTGIDVPSVAGALNAVQARARGKINVRVHPGQDAAEAQDAVVRHLEQVRPFGIPVTVHPREIGNGFFADTTGPAYDAVRASMRSAWGVEASYAASGGSIPLVAALHRAVPDAELILLGTTDGYANIHAPNERVLREEFEKAVVVEAEFFGRYAEAFRAARGEG